MYKSTLLVLLLLCASFATGFAQKPTRDWGTYYGNAVTTGMKIANDRFGNVYMIATTTSGGSYLYFGDTIASPSLATPGSYQPNLYQIGVADFLTDIVQDALLVKFNSNGVRLWATYFGGAGMELGGDVACDSSGNVYITGTTYSSANIATTGPAYAGGGDCFVAKFDSSGLLQWSTYFGGPLSESAFVLTTDHNGDVYMGGATNSTTGISTAGSFQSVYGGGSCDAILAKFSGATGALQWSTYYGGSSYDIFEDFAVDAANNLYTSGTTSSDSGIATPGSHQSEAGGGSDSLSSLGTDDAYIVKFTPSGQRIWSTYYGGNQTEYETAIGYDSTDNYIYLAGLTSSANNIATPGSFQDQNYTTDVNAMDAFVVKFDTAGTRLWGTYYGGAGGAGSGRTSVKCDRYGDVYLMQGANMNGGVADITTPGSFKYEFTGFDDLFLVKFTSAGNRMWGTYYGGNWDTESGSMITSGNDIYVLGSSSSDTGIATPGAFQTNDSANSPSVISSAGILPFIVKFHDCTLDASMTVTGNITLCNGDSITLHANNDLASNYHWQKNGADIPGATDTTLLIKTSGMYSLIVSTSPACADTSMLDTITIRPVPVVNVAINGDTLQTSGFVTYQWNMNGQPISGATDSFYVSGQNATYTVTVTDSNGCTITAGVGLGVANITPETNVVVYPNPVSDELFIDARGPVNVSVYDIEGKLLLSGNKTNIIDVRQLPAATYFLRISDEEGRLMKIDHFVKLN